MEKIVNKSWGKEYWIVNKEYCGKLLEIHKGKSCSLHLHKIKNETFYVLSGKVEIEINDITKTLTECDIVHIERNTLHRFTGIDDINTLIEFSTHHDDSDTYRRPE